MFSITLKGYKEKPVGKMSYLKFQKKDVQLDELEYYIKNGYGFTGIFKAKYPLLMTNKNNDNFDYTHFVMVDIDEEIDDDLNVLLDSLTLPPTIAYTTFHHQYKDEKQVYGNRYRLLYVFDEPLTSVQDVEYMYRYLLAENNLNLKIDNCGKTAVQLCLGSHSQCEFYNTNNIINKEFILKSEGYRNILSEYNISHVAGGGHKDNIKTERRTLLSYCPPKEIVINDNEYLKKYRDIKNVTDSQLFDEYDEKYANFDRNMTLQSDDDIEPIIKVPSDYLQIKRPFRRNNDGKLALRKWKDGEQRRNKLFHNGILRRFIREGLTFEHLLHCLLKELNYYYINVEDTITRIHLIGIAQSVMKANLDYEKYQQRREYYRKANPKFIVNKAYCLSHNVTAQSVVAQYRVKNMDERRLEIFDPSLTDKENVEIFKAHGIGCCLKTMRRFRKRHGIENFKERNKDKQNKDKSDE